MDFETAQLAFGIIMGAVIVSMVYFATCEHYGYCKVDI